MQVRLQQQQLQSALALPSMSQIIGPQMSRHFPFPPSRMAPATRQYAASQLHLRHRLGHAPTQQMHEDHYAPQPAATLDPDHVSLPTVLEYLGLVPHVGNTVRGVLDPALKAAVERNAAVAMHANGPAGDEPRQQRTEMAGENQAAQAPQDGEQSKADSSEDGLRIIHAAAKSQQAENSDENVCRRQSSQGGHQGPAPNSGGSC